MKPYSVSYHEEKREQSCSPCFRTNNKDEAVKRAKSEAQSLANHVDFKRGQFEVWSESESGDGFMEFAAKCEDYAKK